MSLNILPHNTIITFDIHGVLFKPHFKKIASLVWCNKRALKVGFYFLNPKFTFQVIKLLYKQAVPEEYFMTLTSKYPSLLRYRPLAIAISNAQKPVPQIIELVQHLKARGYTLHIFSNIGEHIFADLAHTHAHIFTLFDKAHVPNRRTGYIGKKHPESFALYNQLYNSDKKNIVLIDDNKNNICRAAHVGITGIYFKNINQLYSALHRLKII